MEWKCVGLHVEVNDFFFNQEKLGTAHSMNTRNTQMLDLNMLYALLKRNEQAIRANFMAKKLQQNNVNEFWKEVMVIINSKMPLPSSIDEVTGSENIAELWRKYYRDIF